MTPDCREPRANSSSSDRRKRVPWSVGGHSEGDTPVKQPENEHADRGDGGGGSFEGERVGLADIDMPPRAVPSGSLNGSDCRSLGFADAKRTEVSRFKERRELDVIVSFGDR